MYAKFENNYHLSNKYALFYNMRSYYKALDRDPFEVLPLTYHIREATNDKQFDNFIKMYSIIQSQIKQSKLKLNDL